MVHQNYQSYKKYEDMYQVFKNNGGRFDISSVQVLVPYRQKPMGSVTSTWYHGWLKNKYDLDNSLNGIALMQFDQFYTIIKPFMSKDYPEYSVNMNVCLLKHILIYHILEIEHPKEHPEVELIVSGYKWTCPECNLTYREIAILEEVACPVCSIVYLVKEYHR